VFPGDKFEATRLAASPNGRHLAVGYADGSIKIFDLTNAECICTFSGHRFAITCLSFTAEGHLLASGSKV
jgi:U3 small nucleolar RNA-associated protein 12